jgi:biotin carboxyl carrier protein
MADDVEKYWELGKMYAHDENEYKAFENYKKAADLGHADACFVVGTYYFCGDVVSRDKAIAIEWWKKAAAKGQAQAIKELAELGISTAPSSTSNIPKPTPTCEGQWTPASPIPPRPAPVSNVWQYKAPADGRINATYKDYGDRVKKGARLFEYNEGTNYFVVKAEIDGTVEFHIQYGLVKAGQVILEITPK